MIAIEFIAACARGDWAGGVFDAKNSDFGESVTTCRQCELAAARPG
jgi:hypothetical protein